MDAEKDYFIPKALDALMLLDGDVQSQGIKVDHRDWLDFGSKSWTTTPDAIKAAAYQAALVRNWTDNSLKNAMMDQYKHLKPSTMDMIIVELKALVKKHPLEVIENYQISNDFKVQRTPKRTDGDNDDDPSIEIDLS